MTRDVSNDPAALRELATEVTRQELTEALLQKVSLAVFPQPRGYKGPYERWLHKIVALSGVARVGSRLDYAAMLLPASWKPTKLYTVDYTGFRNFVFEARPDAYPPPIDRFGSIRHEVAMALTEAQARIAVALQALASDLEHAT